MPNRFLAVVIIALTGLVGELHWVLKPRPTPQEITRLSIVRGGGNWVGRVAPDFDLQTTHGGKFKLSENVGHKVIVLNFFATWCGPCQEEMPELVRYARDHRDQPFVLVGIDADEKSPLVEDFLKQNKVNYDVGIDNGSMQGAYGVSGFPTTVLIGVDGKIQFYQVGSLSNANVAFDAFLSANQRMLASGQAISKEAYLRQVAKGSPPPPSSPKTPRLDARAQRIMARMDCPCGCDKRVAACECHTAANIKTALAAGGFGKKSDSEIMQALNRKYCMAGM